MRENFPFNQTSEGEAVKERAWLSQNKTPILLQTTFEHLFLVFVKEDVAAATRGEAERGNGSAFSNLCVCRVSLCPHCVWTQKVKNAPYLNRPSSHITFTHKPEFAASVIFYHLLGAHVGLDVTLMTTPHLIISEGRGTKETKSNLLGA